MIYAKQGGGVPTTMESDEIQILERYEKMCGEMPPADLLGPEVSKAFVDQCQSRCFRTKGDVGREPPSCFSVCTP